MIFELTEQDLELIKSMCDVCLRAGGLQNKAAVDRIISVFSKPIKQDGKAKTS